MTDLNRFTIKRISEDATSGVFIIGPLPRGFGYTVANPLRRILLSSLTGGAVTALRIEGVDHEYSTVAGVQDDVLKIILRLKAIALRCYSDSPVAAKLSIHTKKGEVKQVTAADIVTDASVEIINKDAVITTVSDGGKLDAELTIEKGVGFKLSDSERRSEIGVIPVDGSFSPVENVQIKIGAARVGQNTDLDQIEVSIKTNGVVSPSEAMTEAANIMQNLSSRFVELTGGDMNGEQKAEVSEAQATEVEEEGILVKNLKLSTRLRNALTNSAIEDLRVLDGKSIEDLLEIRGMGQKSVDELVQIMTDYGLKIK